MHLRLVTAIVFGLPLGTALVILLGHTQVTPAQIPLTPYPYSLSPAVNLPAVDGDVIAAEKLTDADVAELKAAHLKVAEAKVGLDAAEAAVGKRHNLPANPQPFVYRQSIEINGSYILLHRSVSNLVSYSAYPVGGPQ